MVNEQAIAGCILGTAVGDALGLPYEGINPDRAKRLLGAPDRYRFFLGRGMVSDDTEHTCMVAQALIESGMEADAFARSFAKRLRWWILALPAGVGKATARSCIKLWLGANPSHSGVYSAGNGPAMRAAILGAAIDDLPQLASLVRASSRVTHTDPKAEFGAIAVALAAREARLNREIDAERWLSLVSRWVREEGLELIALLTRAIESARSRESTSQFAIALGLGRGVTGYTYHTVPVAIHAWLSSPRDFRRAVTAAIECGGDADTTAAIVGGIVGSGVGQQGIPVEWIEGIRESPRSTQWMLRLGSSLAQALAEPSSVRPPTANPAVILLRNAFFLSIVLLHGFRRLAPPY